MNQDKLLAQLWAHVAFDATEAAHQTRLIAFVESTPEPFSRSTAQGHVTGSAVGIDASGESFYLIWHVKLARWLQPGGHCEPDQDSDVAATALRELLEETETEADDWALVDPRPFDLDIHTIPARGEEPAHDHYDIRFLFRARPGLVPPEGKWMPLSEVAALPEPSLARLAKKL